MVTPAPEDSGTESYVFGSKDKPLLNMPVGAALDRAATLWPERAAIVVCDQRMRLSYAALKERTEIVARSLLALGLEPGDRIGIWSPNNLEWVLIQFAAAKAGMVLVSLNPAYRAFEIEYALKTTGCRAIVCATSHKSSKYFEILSQVAPELAQTTPGDLNAVSLPELKLVVQISGPRFNGALPFHDLESGQFGAKIDLSKVEARIRADDPTNIQFTSGTTGAPKGATLSHRNILNNGFFVGEAIELTAEDRVCIPVPFYHCFGMVMGNLACVTHGAAMVVPGASFEAGATLNAISEENCTAIYGVPTMFIAMLGHPKIQQLQSAFLRTGIMAGAPCPIEVMRRIVSELGVRDITIAYGMTETSPVSFQTSRDDTLDRRVSTVGRIQPHIEAKVIDGSGAIVSRGTPGELCTRGYSVMRGYWDDPDRTREVIDEEGWMHTGDLGTIDQDGYCNIVGRQKDMVIRGGENISPTEIENFLHTHPDVLEVQVFGVPDAKFGEEICVWVRLQNSRKIGEEDIRDFCRGRIAHYKVPRYVRFVDAFPMTVTGKVQKFLMREAMRKSLELSEIETA